MNIKIISEIKTFFCFTKWDVWWCVSVWLEMTVHCHWELYNVITSSSSSSAPTECQSLHRRQGETGNDWGPSWDTAVTLTNTANCNTKLHPHSLENFSYFCSSMESVTIQVEHQVERTVQRCTVQRPAVHDMTRADTPLHSAAMYAVKILQLKTTHSQSVKRSKDGLEKFEKL